MQVLDFIEVRKWLQKGRFMHQYPNFGHGPLIPYQANWGERRSATGDWRKGHAGKTFCGTCSGWAGVSMIGWSDEFFDHKDSLVKTRLLVLWEHQLVIRHAQGNLDGHRTNPTHRQGPHAGWLKNVHRVAPKIVACNNDLPVNGVQNGVQLIQNSPLEYVLLVLKVLILIGFYLVSLACFRAASVC